MAFTRLRATNARSYRINESRFAACLAAAAGRVADDARCFYDRVRTEKCPNERQGGLSP